MTDVQLASAEPPRPTRRHFLRRLVRNPMGVAAIAVILIGILAGVLAPALAPYSPDFTDLGESLTAPFSDGHVFGTDSAGRDILSRLLYGARITFLAAAVALVVALATGVPAGLIAGYYGGPFDTIASWGGNALLALPGIIVLLAVRAAWGPSIWIAMAVFGVLMSPPFFRLVRSSVQSVRNELYVDAARVSGLSDARIIGRHVLSVVRAPIVIQAAIVCGIAISIQAGMEFLGLGDGSTITWGMMLNDGFRNVYLAPSLLLWPALAIAGTIAAFVLLGNAIRDALEDDPDGSRRRRGRSTLAPAVAQAAAPAAEHAPAPAEEHAAVPAVVTADSRTAAAPATAAPRAATPEPASTALLSVRDLRIAYPQSDGRLNPVVDGVGFDVHRGEVLGIVGESGSGKSQTAFAILGLLPGTAQVLSGSVEFDGRSLLAPGAMSRFRGRRIAYVPQEPLSNLDPNFTIGHQLVRPMVTVGRMAKKQAAARALELLDAVGIRQPSRVVAAYPHQISGGMAQRVLIAGAVSCEPDLIIADEPTTALDVTVQAEVLDLLRGLRSERGTAIVLVTHNMGVVADICDRVLVMQSAKIVEAGDVRDILRHARDPYTQALLAATIAGKPARTPLMAKVHA